MNFSGLIQAFLAMAILLWGELGEPAGAQDDGNAGAASVQEQGTSPQATTPGAKSPVRRPFRFSTKKRGKMKGVERPGQNPGEKSSGAATVANEKLKEGAVTVGIVSEQAKLPPELKEIARKGTLAVAAKQWKQARAIYLEMLKKAPDNALAYANLGVVEHQLKNLSAAEANLRRSVEINPMIAQNWLSLGLIQYEKGDLTMAISSLTRAIHEAPNEGRIRLVLAAVIRDYGWEEAAITELKRALMIDPKLADAHYNLALSYLSEDPPKLELARRHYYSAIDLGAEPSPDIEVQLGIPRTAPTKK